MNIDPLAPRAPYEVSPRHYSVSHQMATTAFELPNFQVMQTLGGAGYMTDHPVERIYRMARVFRIGGGTSEIQRRLIAKALGL